ncbi:MAG: ABC transporter ATP-binding protein [Lentisphaeria bacterium]|nr:ABC transporter ATP-binding protein [Lentisphaeria bacterium]
MCVIQAEHLTKKYGRKVCVNDLSFELGKNCVLGFIGPNGAGKTTTMRMLCGIMPPSSGRAFIRGKDVTRFPVEAKSLLGYLPENAPLAGTVTVEDFLKYCGNMRGLSGKALKTALERSIEECDLSSVLQEEAESLSKGFRRRVCLAQAIMHQPEALVLDEPTDGLDPNQKREIRALIRKLSSKSAVIVSTHILEEIDAVCDRVLTICKGEKVFDGSVQEFKSIIPEKCRMEITVRLPENAKREEAEKCFFDAPQLGPLLSLTDKKAPLPERELYFSLTSTGENPHPEKEFISYCMQKNYEILSVRTNTPSPDEVFAFLAGGKEEK